jgi:Ca2+-transporting ATPase
MRHPLYQDLIRVYVKGAPEMIVGKCTKTYDVDGRTAAMSPDQYNYIMNDIIHQKFTTQGLRAIAFAYKDFTVNDFELLKKSFHNFASESDRDSLEQQLTLVGVFALEDKLRDMVHRSVTFARRGHINIRLVSGDNLQTAIAAAIQAGIITEEESKHDNACMTGDDFRRQVGGLVQDS